MSKIFYYLFSVLLIISLFSCGSGGDEDGLEGKWDIFYNNVKNCDDSDDNQFFDLTDDQCFIENGIEICATITFDFKGNGNLEANFTFIALGITDTDIQNSTYVIESDKIVTCDDDGCDSISFSINNNKLTLNWQDEEDNCEYEIRGNRI